jgi:hypothetical protein
MVFSQDPPLRSSGNGASAHRHWGQPVDEAVDTLSCPRCCLLAALSCKIKALACLPELCTLLSSWGVRCALLAASTCGRAECLMRNDFLHSSPSPPVVKALYFFLTCSGLPKRGAEIGQSRGRCPTALDGPDTSTCDAQGARALRGVDATAATQGRT